MEHGIDLIEMKEGQAVAIDASTMPSTFSGTMPPWVPELPHRDMPNLEDVVSIIGAWSAYHYYKIREIYWQKGGWEGWAQVELALAFTQLYPKTNTLREQTVYVGSNKRADLTLMLANELTQVIELKVESLWQDQSAGGVTNFVTALKADIKKIDINNLDPQYRPALVYAIGLTCRDEVNEYALDMDHWNPYQNAIHFNELVPSTGDIPALYLWYVGLSRPVAPATDEHTSAYSIEAMPLIRKSRDSIPQCEEPPAAEEGP